MSRTYRQRNRCDIILLRARGESGVKGFNTSIPLCPREAFSLDDGVALATMDIFAGCGGLSEGLHQAHAAVSKWAIEYEAPAAEAFKLNHPGATTFCDNCNVILARAMVNAGLQGDCCASEEVRVRNPNL